MAKKDPVLSAILDRLEQIEADLLLVANEIELLRRHAGLAPTVTEKKESEGGQAS